LQSKCTHPERVIIGHPFYPVYLLPLVETVAGEKNVSQKSWTGPMRSIARLSMFPLRLKKEIDGYICDRLQEALWREALNVLDLGVGTTEDIDRAIIYSAGLRWSIMGSFLHYHTAGGDGGMAAFMAQFDPSLELPWTDLKFPKWSDELTEKLVGGCETAGRGQDHRRVGSEAQRRAGGHHACAQEAQYRRRRSVEWKGVSLDLARHHYRRGSRHRAGYRNRVCRRGRRGARLRRRP
jgi:carnitine 3-dehydrogenase